MFASAPEHSAAYLFCCTKKCRTKYPDSSKVSPDGFEYIQGALVRLGVIRDGKTGGPT